MPGADPKADLTPMLRQYLEVKAQHQDAVLFYRMGDFYEMFFEDAERAAPILEVALTARNKGRDSEAPMCGVPYHAIDGYLAKLIQAGLKVAVCDQVEDPAEAKGLVRREVTRVVTPGTLSEPELLKGKRANYLAGVVWQGEGGGGAFLDLSTGEFFVRRWPTAEAALEELALLEPAELLVDMESLPATLRAWAEREPACWSPLSDERWLDRRRAADTLSKQLNVGTLRGLGLEAGEPAVTAAAAVLTYARTMQHNDLSHVNRLRVRGEGEVAVLDSTTVANLELFRSLRDGSEQGTLLSCLDRTCSAAGGRRLRQWLRAPLRTPTEIDARLDAVEELAEPMRRQRVRALLSRTGDPQRLLSRAVLGTLTPREAAALRDGLALAPALLGEIRGCQAALLAALGESDPVVALQAELERVLAESPAANLKHGGVIGEGVDPELDRSRSLAQDSKKHLLALEQRERQATGITSLKARYNKVFGYYLEVTKANQELVPDHYIRKQTLVNAERYITPELKELEEQILTAEERQITLEERHFKQLLESITAARAELLELGEAQATLDVVTNFAEVAARNGYVRPKISQSHGPIRIREGRHPVVERLSSDPFVPNDCELDGSDTQVIILTGPNMGGKSTYLRQVALQVLMAQMGCYVPADSAEIGVVDRIFTRVGASDDLTRGESTFMVEMIETSNILHFAGGESLVILDEVGRGTATFDGLSLAWAIVEHLHESVGAKTLFATHYHELTELATLLPRVANRTMAVKEWNDEIVFLRRVVAGSSDKSYGLHVARLAGIPPQVIERAATILHNLEAQEYDFTGKPRVVRDVPPVAGDAVEEKNQLQLFAPPEQMVATVIREVDLERLAPLAALNLLHSLKSRLPDS